MVSHGAVRNPRTLLMTPLSVDIVSDFSRPHLKTKWCRLQKFRYQQFTKELWIWILLRHFEKHFYTQWRRTARSIALPKIYKVYIFLIYLLFLTNVEYKKLWAPGSGGAPNGVKFVCESIRVHTRSRIWAHLAPPSRAPGAAALRPLLATPLPSGTKSN